MKNRYKNLFKWSLILLFDTANQIFMKYLGLEMGNSSFNLNWLLAAASSYYLWLAFACDVGSFVVWMLIIRDTDISYAAPVSSINFITILFAGTLLFQEVITVKQIIGIFFVLSGVILINTQLKLSREPEYS